MVDSTDIEEDGNAVLEAETVSEDPKNSSCQNSSSFGGDPLMRSVLEKHFGKNSKKLQRERDEGPTSVIKSPKKKGKENREKPGTSKSKYFSDSSSAFDNSPMLKLRVGTVKATKKIQGATIKIRPQ